LTKSIVVLGAGGHAAVLVEMLITQKFDIRALVSPDKPKNTNTFANLAHWQDEAKILKLDPKSILLVNGIGSMPRSHARQEVYKKFTEAGFKFLTLISPHAFVSPSVEIGSGVQIMAGSIIQTGCKIGDNSIVNTGAIVDHGCQIGRHNHLAPGATLSGEVVTAEGVHIGTGATLIQGIQIAAFSIIGAGAIVTKSVTEKQIIYPARNTSKPI